MDDVLNNEPCGFLTFTDDGKIVEANLMLLKILGYEHKELVSIPVEKIFSVAGRVYYQTHVFPLLKLQNNIKEIYLSLRSKTGEDIPVLINAVRHEREGKIFNDCVFVEMRRRDLYENEILHAKKIAEETTHLKDTFLATISHELRTPLNAILGWAKMISSGKLDAGGNSRAIETIIRSAKSQAQLIEDLLDISRIVSGKLRLDIRPVELPPIIEAAIESISLAAEAKSIHIQTSIDPKAAAVTGDSERLQQIFWNLLSNAIKFTPKGGKIQVRLERINSHLEFSVSDTGQGIEKEFLPFVFEQFRQADGASTRSSSGIGLGLAIVRNLVELHGGSIYAESDGLGSGAVFTVILPLRISNSSQIKNNLRKVHPGVSGVIAFESAPILAGIKVVIIDDEEDSRVLLKEILAQSGAEVTLCSSVLAVIETIQSVHPHIMISDIGMPDEDGYSLIAKVRALPLENGGQTPAIALTGYARVEDRIKVLSSGFQMFIPKPLEPTELVAAVGSLARMSGKPI